MTTNITPNFQRMVDMIDNQLVLKPLVESYLLQAKFPNKFTVTFHKAGQQRRPDGFFHPSTHPMWSARMLYYYMTAPDLMESEHLSYESRMAVTMGTAVHGFIEMCIRDAGLMLPLEGICPACDRPHGTKKDQCDEYGVVDQIGVRGHMDGILRIKAPGRMWDQNHPGVFEFKCLAVDTPVSMADGTTTPADKISAGDRILGWNGQTGRLVPVVVSAAWDNGEVPIWTVRTREGRRIGVTDEHPFLTKRGWVFAKDLLVGDKVRVAFDCDWAQGSGDADEAYFLGALVGDGGLTGPVINFTNVDAGVLEAMSEYAKRHGCALKKNTPDSITYRITTPLGSQQNPLLDLVRREELMGKNSRQKVMPRSVMTGGPQSWIGFLSGYFDTDGTVVTTGSYPHLSWASVNHQLLIDCQLLLGYLGIRSSVMEIAGRYNGQPHQSWRLLVRDAEAVTAAMRTLRLRSSTKTALLASLLPKVANPRMVRTAQGGWDTVSEVSQGPVRPTIAIEVEGGTHVTAGIITHNTSNPNKARGLKDNDLVMFRQKWPEYYGQVQDYMEASGLRQAIVLIAILGFPWKLVEIQVPYDPGYVMELRRKYQVVRDHEKMLIPPDPCCAPFSAEAKACPARYVCPIGTLRA